MRCALHLRVWGRTSKAYEPIAHSEETRVHYKQKIKFTTIIKHTHARQRYGYDGPLAGPSEACGRRGRISKQSLDCLTHRLWERRQVVATLKTIQTGMPWTAWDVELSRRQNSKKDKWRECRWETLGMETSSLTSRTAHSLPPARFIRRWVRWAKMSGLAHIWPWKIKWKIPFKKSFNYTFLTLKMYIKKIFDWLEKLCNHL